MKTFIEVARITKIKLISPFFVRLARKIYNIEKLKKIIKQLSNEGEQIRIRNMEPIELNEITIALIEKIKEHAQMIYGSNWNYYSDTLRSEVAKNFEDSINILETLKRPINYLEIGSAQGLSMSLNALLLKQKNIAGKLISLDPYYIDGYTEGLESP